MEISKPNFLIVCFFLVILGGCKTVETVVREYQRVKYNDGINVEEAKLIAQNVMTESRYSSSYDVLDPELINTEATVPYPNFWFISFPAQDEFSKYGHVVVVDKLTGGVIRSSDYEPAVQSNFDWLIRQK